ncbi:XRE family transcriptional regulator [Actinoplanes sp. N902-109]|uniref:XRE family transcriptional regulator n=1 Tax=Actinoplanes sp. (strain N902-109) TaxID=649831 RepID=UPI0012FA34BB|nr:XRE family transcriptional regulator [Actinoplanes sp. N902-109]
MTTAVPPDPTGATTAAQLAERLGALLRARRRSVDSVVRRSRDTGTPISRATVYNLLGNTGVPRRESLVRFLRGCGVPPPEQIRWLAAFDRVHPHPMYGTTPAATRGRLGSAA